MGRDMVFSISLNFATAPVGLAYFQVESLYLPYPEVTRVHQPGANPAPIRSIKSLLWQNLDRLGRGAQSLEASSL
jgi:hypothetical protein